MSREFHRLRVAETREEIGGAAKSVMFEVPTELAEIFRWRAGQHLTLRLQLDGEEQRRSYTISSSPHTGSPLRITVKRVKDGLVSNHINDHVSTGTEIDVMPPFGSFCLDPGDKERRTHYFFGAGSGITPLFSMIGSVLAAEPHSVAHLVYGNRNEKSIIFKDDLAALQESHPERLTVSHVLSSPGLLTWFTPWRSGKIDKEAVGAQIDENPPYAQDAQYYICGPGGMNGALKEILRSYDVPDERIHMESFGGAQVEDLSITGVDSAATVVLSGETHLLELREGQTILDAANKAELNPPYSCQSGICGACRARLIKGSVHMRSRPALEDHEIEKGAILTCQAVATSPEIELTFD